MGNRKCQPFSRVEVVLVFLYLAFENIKEKKNQCVRNVKSWWEEMWIYRPAGESASGADVHIAYNWCR